MFDVNWTTLTASDWFQFLGVVVAAVVGVLVAVWGQAAARKAAYVDRLDSALAVVIVALGKRALDVDAWAAPAEVPIAGSLGQRYTRPDRGEGLGGPLNAEVHMAVEAAWLLATKRKDRVCLEALAVGTNGLTGASARWQIANVGQVVASLRGWRTGGLTERQFRANMAEVARMANQDRARYE